MIIAFLLYNIGVLPDPCTMLGSDFARLVQVWLGLACVASAKV